MTVKTGVYRVNLISLFLYKMNKSIVFISTLGDILLLSLNRTAWIFDEMSTNQINVTSKQFTFHVSIKKSNTTSIICDDTNYFVFHGVILSSCLYQFYVYLA